mgnify:CR=1 FL=1
MCRAVREGGGHKYAASAAGCIGHGFLKLMETDLYLKVGGEGVFSGLPGRLASSARDATQGGSRGCSIIGHGNCWACGRACRPGGGGFSASVLEQESAKGVRILGRVECKQYRTGDREDQVVGRYKAELNTCVLG